VSLLVFRKPECLDHVDRTLLYSSLLQLLTSSPKNKDIQIESGSFILVESLLDHTAEPIINLPDSSPLYLPSSPFWSSVNRNA
jgi:hypothetical protein